MRTFIDALLARRAEIARQIKVLEQYIREAQLLENELRHIDVLLAMHKEIAEQSNSLMRQGSDSSLLYIINDKVPSGIARHIIVIFTEDNKPLPINEIHKRLKEKGIDATMSGINTALRRNASYFEQIDKFFWRLKQPQDQPREQREHRSRVHETPRETVMTER